MPFTSRYWWRRASSGSTAALSRTRAYTSRKRGVMSVGGAVSALNHPASPVLPGASCPASGRARRDWSIRATAPGAEGVDVGAGGGGVGGGGARRDGSIRAAARGAEGVDVGAGGGGVGGRRSFWAMRPGSLAGPDPCFLGGSPGGGPW